MHRFLRALLVILLPCSALLDSADAQNPSSSSTQLGVTATSDGDSASVFETHPSERLLLSITQAFGAEGSLGFRTPTTVQELWERADPQALAQKIRQRFSTRGALVAANKIFADPAGIKVLPTSSRTFNVVLGGISRFILRSMGLRTCQRTAPTTQSLDTHVEVAAFLQCQMSLYLRGYLEAHDFGALPEVEKLGLDAFLKSKLDPLVALHLLDSYQVKADEKLIIYRARLSDGTARTMQISIDYSLANPFPDSKIEAAWVKESLSTSMSTTIGAETGRSDGESELYFLEPERVAHILEVVSASGATSAQARHAALIAEVEYKPEGGNSSDPCGDFPQYTYDPGTITPANNEVVEFIGADHNGALSSRDAFGPIKALLSQSGYHITRIDGRALKEGQTSQLCLFRKAQTWLMAVHGAKIGSSAMQCYPGIEYGTKACCEALALMLKAFNPGSEMSRCDTQSNIDAVMTNIGESTGGNDCAGKFATRGRANRCMGRLFKTSTLFPQPERQVAAVFFESCYSGRLADDTSGPNDVMDIMIGSSDQNTPATSACDFAQAARDLGGDSQYCRDMVPPRGIEPYEGGACSPETRGVFPSPSSSRTMQGSAEMRGARSPDDVSWFCRNSYNDLGLKRYQVSSVGGRPNVFVEFTPMISYVRYLPAQHYFSFTFSSEVNPDPATSKVEVDFVNARKTDEALPDFESPPSIDAMGGAFTISGAYALLTAEEWGLPADELEYRYGFSQGNWPSYAMVTITAKAPNGAPLAGNTTPDWIWPKPDEHTLVPGWAKWNGRNGVHRFQVKLPIVMSWACCLPRFEVRRDHGGLFVNGCSCSDASPRRCVSYACEYRRSDGSPQYGMGIPPADCAASGGTSHTAQGQATIWADCCSGDLTHCDSSVHETTSPYPQCPDGAGQIVGREFPQFKTRPWNDQDPSRCPAHQLFLGCGGE